MYAGGRFLAARLGGGVVTESGKSRLGERAVDGVKAGGHAVVHGAKALGHAVAKPFEKKQGGR